MLTAHGQLSQRIGPLLPTVDGVNPKCVQAYFCGSDNATKWRMIHGVKNNASRKEKKSYETLFKVLDDMLKMKLSISILNHSMVLKSMLRKS